MALKMVKGSIDRMFDKNLQDLVRGIRNHKEDEVSPARRAGPARLCPTSAPVPTWTPTPASSSSPKPRSRLEPCLLATRATPRPLSPRASVYPRGPKTAPGGTRAAVLRTLLASRVCRVPGGLRRRVAPRGFSAPAGCGTPPPSVPPVSAGDWEGPSSCPGLWAPLRGPPR